MEERTDKGMDQNERRKRNVKIRGKLRKDATAAYNEMFRKNCETFQEILIAIYRACDYQNSPPKNYHELSYAWPHEKNYHRLS